MAEKATILLHCGEVDKVYTALIMVIGTLSMGVKVSLYSTFWGLIDSKKMVYKKNLYRN